MQTPTITKLCPTCKTEKLLSLFSKDNNKKSGLRSQCKDCIRQYQINNKILIAEQMRNYYQNNKKYLSVLHSEYKKTKKGKAVQRNAIHKRRAIFKNGNISTEDILYLQQNAKLCYWCNANLNNKKVHIDHYIPLSKGGEHTLSNLVVSCQKCNNQKHAKDPIEFANSIGKLL